MENDSARSSAPSHVEEKREKRRANRRPLAMVAADPERIEKLRVDVWDGGLRGFGIRVSKNARSWLVMYRFGGKLQRMTIGNALFMPYAEARERAVDVLGCAARGEDPKVAAPKPEVVTVREAFRRYMLQHVTKNLAPRTAQSKREMFERDVLPGWGERPVESITNADVIGVFDRVSERGPISGNRTLEGLLAFLNWCLARELTRAAIVVDNKRLKADEPERERVLDGSDEEQRIEDKVEIRSFWRACDAIGKPFGAMFKLLLLTAQRRDEVREMRWEEIDLDNGRWVIPAERAKNRNRHTVALSEPAIAVLTELGRQDKGLVFPAEFRRVRGATAEAAISGHSRAKARLDAEMARLLGRPVERFTLHDLRRTAATEMAEMGIAVHVIDKLLNHKTGTIRGIAKVYNRHEYRPEQRDALVRWGRRLAAIVGDGDPVQVLDFPGRGVA